MIRYRLFFLLALSNLFLYGDSVYEMLCKVYPEHIQSISPEGITWRDGSFMPIERDNIDKSDREKLENPSLYDQLHQPLYFCGEPIHAPQDDPGRIRYEPFFFKMYGGTKEEVQSHLVPISWMRGVFGDSAKILWVTTVNNINTIIQKISDECEILAKKYPEYIPFLSKPGGTFNWRKIANTDRLSAHSFGMTIDINAHASNYWQWDLKAEGREISEQTELVYKNNVPWPIVAIFEKYGFIWGGKWYHYDTMHFEYRPELMVNS